LNSRSIALQGDKREFEEWAAKIRETALRLNEERDKVLAEKIQYEGEREALEVQMREVEMQRSIL